ncbi:conjugal transfer protein TraF [Endozoicomonas sp. 4G]|uniref:conjugal transfer protein TraF n=1 Tax=Endozoicomonas sp. 4G TaxID=2872754 RepID=UPI0020789646|nr:conjugal transfer protein TraF [Endozoicomonas sp. 4G]
MPFVLLLIGLFSVTAFAEQQWFSRHSEGWFWYEQIPEPETDENKANDQNESHQPLTTAWIRNNIGHYLDKAIDLPSKENVSNYLYLDRLIKEKAERFAYVGKQVIEGDPMLDENVRRPISPAAAKIRDDTAYKAREIILRKIARMAGLVFFYQGSCRLCHIQARTVQLLSMEYGFELIPISTDGQLIPELPNSRTERSPPASLNIATYPALFLMQPPDNIVLIRQGATSLTALAERLVDVAYQQGWINKDEYQKTRITNETWGDGLPPEKIHLFSKPRFTSHQ